LRILGIDFGLKRIGLALSDPMGIIASPLKTLTRSTDDADILHIAAIVKGEEVSTIVIGLPKNMDGTEGGSALNARAFGEKLGAATDIKIVFKDERLSSVSANRVLDEAGMHWSKRKEVVDTMAAQIILQSYLDIRR